LDVSFCLEALEEALTQARPEIFNADEVGQYTSEAFSGLLKHHNIQISITERGCWDNLMIERLWPNVKYEHLYLHAYEDGHSLARGLKHYFHPYNYENPHSSLQMAKPYQRWAS